MATDVMLSNTGAALTMSSAEIAELTGKKHAHVLRDIRTMLETLKDDPSLDHVREDRDGRGYTSCFWLTRELTEVLITGYSAPLRLRVIRRLHDLENQTNAIPKTLPEALRLAADLAEQNNSLRLVVSQQEPKVRALQQLADAAGTLCITDAAKQLSIQPKVLIEWMSANRWIYRRGEGKPWLAYGPRMTAGLLWHKTSVIGVGDDGVQRIASQVRVTPKGLTVLAQRVPGVAR